LENWGKVAIFAAIFFELPMQTSGYVLTLLCCLGALPAFSWDGGGHSFVDGLELMAEMQTSNAVGNTPLWLNANKYGLSSLEGNNGYFRLALERDLGQDDGKVWGIGYGADLYRAYNYLTDVNIQQLYLKLRYRAMSLTIGQREEPSELVKQELSSGSQTLGFNARPVPGVRMAIDEYWGIPGLNDWIGIKGHVFFGVRADGDWNERFVNGNAGYFKNVMQHTKAGYLRLGSPRYPLTLEGGLQMATLWGGMLYDASGNVKESNRGELSQLLDALVCKENNAGGVTSVGNVLGSWVMKLNYCQPDYDFHLYADYFFERKSGMFFSNSDVETKGADGEASVRKLRYPLKDIQLGLEMNAKWSKYVNGVVFEYLYTKYQQGPIGHESSAYIPDVVSGMNSFYNHGATSWFHWGQVLGNPLYRSPIYNEGHSLSVENNRFVALHLGVVISKFAPAKIGKVKSPLFGNLTGPT